jgi:hypothetical protein
MPLFVGMAGKPPHIQVHTSRLYKWCIKLALDAPTEDGETTIRM